MKILIAEDNSISRRALEIALAKWGYEVIATSDGVQALAALQIDDAPRLAILDWLMPGMDGIQVCRQIRQRTDAAYVYVLLLTGKDGKHDIVEGLEAGADDYLVKPFDAPELKARLSVGKRIIDLQDHLISARDALRVQATHDSLTSLWNRAAMLEFLERDLARSRREGTPVGVIMADVDHFKKINDTHGHLIGDAVLQAVARRMHSSMRPYDTLGRYGGEEFLVILPGCDAATGVKVAERLREHVGGSPLDSPAGPLPVTISLGVASSRETQSSDTDNLIRAADAALYHAKHAGRNRVELKP